MKKEFVMRGQTATGGIETLHFSGFKEGYAYRMTEFQLYPSTNIGGGATADFEASASVTAGKVALNPAAPDFNNDSLIATALFLKVPEQVNADNHSIGGYTYLNWGINTRADHLSLKPKQDKFIIPKIGQFILFPSWLKYSFIPFTGEGTLRVLLAKFNVRFSV